MDAVQDVKTQTWSFPSRRDAASFRLTRLCLLSLRTPSQVSHTEIKLSKDAVMCSSQRFLQAFLPAAFLYSTTVYSDDFWLKLVYLLWLLMPIIPGYIFKTFLGLSSKALQTSEHRSSFLSGNMFTQLLGFSEELWGSEIATTELLHFMEDKQNLICVPFSAINYLSGKRLFSEIVHIMDSKSVVFSSKPETSVLTFLILPWKVFSFYETASCGFTA